MPDYLKKLFTVDDKIVTYRFVNGVYQARFRRDGYVNDGRNRTAQKLYTMLKAIFSVACEDFGIKSPMAKVTLPHYEIKKGKAFTKANEKTIIENAQGLRRRDKANSDFAYIEKSFTVD